MTTCGLILTILLASVGAAAARSVRFALMTDILNLGRSAQIYHEETGAYPATWQQFEERFGPARKIGGIAEPQERFAFVGTPVYLHGDPSKERILLISREPFRPPTEGRIPVLGIYYTTVAESVYVAVVQQGDGVFIREISPERALMAFAQAGAKLPEQSGLGLYPHERAHRAQTISLGIVACAGCALGIWAIIVRKKRRSEQVEVSNPQ